MKKTTIVTLLMLVIFGLFCVRINTPLPVSAYAPTQYHRPVITQEPPRHYVRHVNYFAWNGVSGNGKRCHKAICASYIGSNETNVFEPLGVRNTK